LIVNGFMEIVSGTFNNVEVQSRVAMSELGGNLQIVNGTVLTQELMLLAIHN